jgi:hypothetical protein
VFLADALVPTDDGEEMLQPFLAGLQPFGRQRAGRNLDYDPAA